MQESKVIKNLLTLRKEPTNLIRHLTPKYGILYMNLLHNKYRQMLRSQPDITATVQYCLRLMAE